ncbi:hypothetical protein CEP52_007436 [Fusarium oligoseptatum]|uniref:Uncharacterized protein n=1 Tax=Fusarium oligoseptatum TaxID=2604345 RepID=A0A428TMT6_9HYPO|nr:hypothetical protein CEP52_007436 [Fusarium oligoseptatum]
MSDFSIRETIEFDVDTPLAEHVNNAVDSDNQTDVGSDHTPSPDDHDSFGEDFDHEDFSSQSVSPDDANVESPPAESDSRTESHASPSPKISRLSQLFTNFADEFLDIVEEDAQAAVIAAAKAQNTDLGKMVNKHDHEIGRLTDEFYDHVSSHDKGAKEESEKVRSEMKRLKRSIKNRDLNHNAFQEEVGDRFASLEQSVVDRLLLLEKITSNRMTRLEKSINARFASLEKSMNDRLTELEERID